jgi:hypothetical protein
MPRVDLGAEGPLATIERSEMKYVLLIHGNPQSWGHPTFARTEGFLASSEAERKEMDEQFGELMREIHESGELVDSAPLADPGEALVVSVRDGSPVTTDGPFGEAKEHMAGYFVLDCASREPTPTPAESEAQIDSEVLQLLLTDGGFPWSVEELGRACGDPLAAEDAVGRLGRAGLLHRTVERLVFPTRAGRYFNEI